VDFPAQFGDYELLERIATGGMAEVFLARTFGVEGFQKRLVIKRILPGLAGSERFVSMFVKEAKISSLLSHPNVVQVFDLGRVGDDYYMAMAFIHGRDLTRTVKRLRSRGSSLPLGLAVHIGACLARGLAYAHGRCDPDGRPLGIIHRDVSPHNVMVSFEGQVQLLDFGIARLAGEAETDTRGKTGRPGGGKFAYMSPEQAGGAPIDHRSDIFSCGIVLYELLVNHRLFAHSDPNEKLRRVRNAVVPDPRLENSEITDSLWAILRRALAQRPEDRYETAGSLEEELRALLYAEGLRGDDASLGAFMRELWREDLAPDRAALQMGDLVRALGYKESHTGLDDPPSEPSHRTAVPASIDSEEPRREQRPMAERKVVTVLCGELIGLTDVSAVLDPDALIRRYGQLRKLVDRAGRRYGGWLERFDDDTFTLVFGVPKTHEDDVDRACHSARHVLRSLGRLRRKGVQVQAALGLHCGEVVLSGQEGSWICLPRGDGLKLARRLALVAEPGQILVSGAVASWVSVDWRFAAGPRMRQQGRREETLCFSLEDQRRRGRPTQAARWIPRGDELERLGEGLALLAAGQGGVVGIRGETGSGKSLLFRELELLAEQAGLPMFRGRTHPYGSDRPLTPFRELVADVLGIDAEAGPKVVRGALSRLAELQVGGRDTATLAHLFSVDLNPSEAPPQVAFFDVGLRLVRGLAEEAPVLLALEDIHYMDPTERALLRHLLRLTADVPILWLLSWGADPGLVIRRSVRLIKLGPMSRGAQHRLVAELLGAEICTEALAELVAQSSGGNPLYIEELVKALQSSDRIALEGKVADLVAGNDDRVLPPTLEGLISARVDALDPASKGALQLAATIGMSFGESLLGQAMGLDDPRTLIEDLVDQGLVRSEGTEQRYIFASYMVWEVVRRSILGVQLRDHHGMVASGMERLYQANLEPHLESLALHCAQAGRLIDAARYGQRAGDLHRAASLLERALASYRRAIRWLEAAAPEPDSVQGGVSVRGADAVDADADLRLQGEAVLHHRAGEVGALLGRYRLAERHLQIALELANEALLGDVEASCHLSLGKLYAEQGKRTLATAHLDQSLSQARLMRDLRRQVDALTSRASLAVQQGDAAHAQACCDEALELSTEREDPRMAAEALVAVANLLIRSGQDLPASQYLERARVLADAGEDRILVGRIIHNLGLVHLQAKRLEQALACFREALARREHTGYQQGLIVNLHYIGDVLLRLGRPGRAWTAFEQSRDAARSIGLDKAVAFNEVFLGYLMAERGELEGGLALLRDARQRAVGFGDQDTAVVGLWLEGRALLNAGRLIAARSALDDALERTRDASRRWLSADVRSTLAAFPGAVSLG
jgi:serine/threonine protein kinase/tetratricopeptide (TPR) repeat protein